MQRQLFLVLPALAGGVAMAWCIYQSHFLPTNVASLVWAVVFLGPFTFVGVVAWRSRKGSAIAAVLPALLLAAIPLVCFSDGFTEGSQFLLLLSPLYLWVVVAVTAVLELTTRKPCEEDV